MAKFDLNDLEEHQPKLLQKDNSPKRGRPKKKPQEALTQRVTVLMTDEQLHLLNRRRGADRIGEIDAGVFLREWLKRTGCFDKTGITKYAPDNLPPERELERAG